MKKLLLQKICFLLIVVFSFQSLFFTGILSAEDDSVKTYSSYWNEVQKQRVEYESQVGQIKKKYEDFETNETAQDLLQQAEKKFNSSRQQIAQKPEYQNVSSDDTVEKKYWSQQQQKYQQDKQKAKKRLDARLKKIRSEYPDPSENAKARQEIQNATNEYYDQSREMASKHQKNVQDMVLDELKKKSAGGTAKSSAPIKKTAGSGYYEQDEQTGAIKKDSKDNPILNRKHRGTDGDTDVEAGARTADADTIRNILVEKGMGNVVVDEKPGYVSIGEGDDAINLTINKSGEDFGEPGSSAHETKVQVDAESKETYTHIKMKKNQPGRSYVAVQDHKKKALKGLSSEPKKLLGNPDALQGMAKGASKSIEEADISKEKLKKIIADNGLEGTETPASLKSKLKKLKEGQAVSPDGVGLNEKNIGKYQKVAGQIIEAAEEKTRAKKDAELEAADNEIKKLRQSTDPDDRKRATELKKQVLDTEARVQATETANNNKAKLYKDGKDPDDQPGLKKPKTAQQGVDEKKARIKELEAKRKAREQQAQAKSKKGTSDGEEVNAGKKSGQVAGGGGSTTTKGIITKTTTTTTTSKTKNDDGSITSNTNTQIKKKGLTSSSASSEKTTSKSKKDGSKVTITNTESSETTPFTTTTSSGTTKTNKSDNKKGVTTTTSTRQTQQSGLTSSSATNEQSSSKTRKDGSSITSTQTDTVTKTPLTSSTESSTTKTVQKKDGSKRTKTTSSADESSVLSTTTKTAKSTTTQDKDGYKKTTSSENSQTHIGGTTISKETEGKSSGWVSKKGAVEADRTTTTTTTKIGNTTVGKTVSTKDSLTINHGDDTEKPTKKAGPNVSVKLADTIKVDEKGNTVTQGGDAAKIGENGEISGGYKVETGHTKHTEGTTITIEKDGSVKVGYINEYEKNALKVTAGGKISGKAGGVGGTLEAKGEFTAGGRAGFKADISVGKDGIKSTGEVDIFIGMKAEGEVSGTLDLKDNLGIAVKGTLKGEVSAGAGIKAGYDAQIGWTKITLSGHAAATLGLGAGGQGSVDIDISVLTTGVDLEKVGQQDKENAIMSKIIKSVKIGKTKLPKGKKWSTILPEMNKLVEWLAKHPEKLTKDQKAYIEIMKKLGFEKGKGKQKYISVRKKSKDWYCTNKPNIQSKAPVSEMIRSGK